LSANDRGELLIWDEAMNLLHKMIPHQTRIWWFAIPEVNYLCATGGIDTTVKSN